MCGHGGGCEHRAQFNARMVNGRFVAEGDQVAIDGESEVTYTALCARHYLEDVGPIAADATRASHLSAMSYGPPLLHWAGGTAQTQRWPSPAHFRPGRPHWYRLRPQERDPVGDVAPGDGLRQRDDVLATLARLAESGVWRRLHRLLLQRLQDAGRIDWERASLDSGSSAGSRGAKRLARIRRIAAS